MEVTDRWSSVVGIGVSTTVAHHQTLPNEPMTPSTWLGPFCPAVGTIALTRHPNYGLEAFLLLCISILEPRVSV